MRYLAFIHTDETGYGISFPDFPGCISAGDSLDAAIHNGIEALALHTEGEALPAPRTAQEVMADPGLADWREGAQFAYVPLLRDLGSSRRVNVSLDPGLLAAIDDEAARRGVTRSAFLSSAARQQLLAS